MVCGSALAAALTSDDIVLIETEASALATASESVGLLRSRILAFRRACQLFVEATHECDEQHLAVGLGGRSPSAARDLASKAFCGVPPSATTGGFEAVSLLTEWLPEVLTDRLGSQDQLGLEWLDARHGNSVHDAWLQLVSLPEAHPEPPVELAEAAAAPVEDLGAPVNPGVNPEAPEAATDVVLEPGTHVAVPVAPEPEPGTDLVPPAPVPLQATPAAVHEEQVGEDHLVSGAMTAVAEAAAATAEAAAATAAFAAAAEQVAALALPAVPAAAAATPTEVQPAVPEAVPSATVPTLDAETMEAQRPPDVDEAADPRPQWRQSEPHVSAVLLALDNERYRLDVVSAGVASLRDMYRPYRTAHMRRVEAAHAEVGKRLGRALVDFFDEQVSGGGVA